jgi:hypothetical protein
MLGQFYVGAVIGWDGRRITIGIIMSSISETLRQQVSAEAAHCCEYCRTCRQIIGMSLVIAGKNISHGQMAVLTLLV